MWKVDVQPVPPLLLLLALLAGGSPEAAYAQERATLLIGTYLEKNYSTQPGVQVAYAAPGLLGGRTRVSAAYSTTRLATALGSHALAEDRFQLGAAWHFLPAASASPYVGLNLGYTRFDRENDEIFALLDNGAPILSLLLGTELRVREPLRLNAGIGYSAVQSSTVHPFVATLGLHYALERGRR
jgi:hypothetical protein